MHTRKFAALADKARVFINLDPVTYWSLLGNVDLLIGNSSSGIMESASYALPTVNIGMRQQGREQPQNIVNAEANQSSILDAIHRAQTEAFRSSLKDMINPYGCGHAAERIADVLATVPLDRLLIKQPVQPIDETEVR